MYLKDQAIILGLRALAGRDVDRQFTVKVSDSAGVESPPVCRRLSEVVHPGFASGEG